MTEMVAPQPGPVPPERPADSGFRITIRFRPPSAENPGGYIGASSSWDPLPGETWERGRDLPDGKWSRETLDRVMDSLIAHFYREP